LVYGLAAIVIGSQDSVHILLAIAVLNGEEIDGILSRIVSYGYDFLCSSGLTRLDRSYSDTCSENLVRVVTRLASFVHVSMRLMGIEMNGCL
jgi:hypothetical protein